MKTKKYNYGSAILSAFEYLLKNYKETFVIGQGLWSPWYVGNSMTDLDKKMSSFHGMCFDCASKMKTKMMLDGTWEEYEKDRVKKNAMAWLKDAENDVLEIKKAMTKTEFVNSNGSVEKWSLDKKQETIVQEIDDQWAKYKEDFKNKFGITDEDLRTG